MAHQTVGGAGVDPKQCVSECEAGIVAEHPVDKVLYQCSQTSVRPRRKFRIWLVVVESEPNIENID